MSMLRKYGLPPDGVWMEQLVEQFGSPAFDIFPELRRLLQAWADADFTTGAAFRRRVPDAA